jgi:8-oxo-dGTP pyrophosphatase MutT (NUDIX family)
VDLPQGASLPVVPAQPLHFVVAAVCLRDDRGRLLSVRKQGTERFMLPGGKLEPGETAREAAIREIREEVGVELADVELLGEFHGAAANEPGATLESTVFTARALGEPVACAEIAEVRWVDPEDLPADLLLAPLLEHQVVPVLLGRSPQA